jgi:hypothetical protein
MPRARSASNRFWARARAERIALRPKRARAKGWRGGRGGPSSEPTIRSQSRTIGPISFSYARPSVPSVRPVASTERSSTAADPSSKGWASGADGWIHSRPCSPSGSVLKNGEAYPRGCMAEPRSWTKPGSVTSAERVPPPTVSSASSTATERPPLASSTAAARPFGPAPTTTASYAPRSVTRPGVVAGRASSAPLRQTCRAWTGRPRFARGSLRTTTGAWGPRRPSPGLPARSRRSAPRAT